MDGVKELVDLTNDALPEDSKYVTKDKLDGGDGYHLMKR